MLRKYKIYGMITLGFFFMYKIKEWIDYQEYLQQDRIIEQMRIEPVDLIEENEQELWTLDERQCLSKRTNIAFIKTHKTASSTVTSILNKYADINELDVALPAGNTRFDWPHPFKYNTVDGTRLKHQRANILCNHSVLSRRELLKIMMPGFRLITILRHPVDQIYSLFHFENFTRIYQIRTDEDPVQLFFQNTTKYYRTFKSRIYREIFELENLLKNGQVFDLNYQRFQKRPRKNTFKDFIKYLDQILHFVLITEYFDEGLVLLKRKFCWNYLDIVYDKKLVNPRVKNHKQNRTKELKDKILKWNNLDWIVYQYFRLKFEKIMATQNQEVFQDDVLKFQELNKNIVTFCNNQTQSHYQEVINYLQEIREEPYWLLLHKPKCFCDKLKRPELHYLKYFRDKYPSYWFANKLQRGQKRTDMC